ncbi:hypothetical protein GCM10009430_39540 [Aquimarina litoralis]|uniref:DUF4249 domain-containing protein n=1 Tax=Aquimarina litoralis TaxID=584605 RepID=A0ABP3UD37_9FLAO
MIEKGFFLFQSNFETFSRRVVLGFLVLFGLNACTEPFDLSNENIEDFLVVNARITDELTNHRIVLSRTIGFGNNVRPIYESGATIVVTENNATNYSFSEIESGIYESDQEFRAVSGQEYQLSIRTQNGLSYRSDKVIAPQQGSLDEVYVKRMRNEDGVDGVGIFVNSFDPSGNSKFYRFGYEETFRVSAPLWISVDVEPKLTPDGIGFRLVERPESQKVCYQTQLSNNINLVNTSGFAEDRIQDLPIRFIPADDIVVAERYSILVNQFIQTQEAQSFYRVLDDFSGSDNLFAQIQPGFIGGNIFLENDPDTKALGFFDVSSLSQKRVFFDHDDFLGDLPPFELDCEEVVPPQPANSNISIEERLEILRGFIIANKARLKVPPYIPPPGEFPTFVFIPRECGDCTALGKAEAPEFWIE